MEPGQLWTIGQLADQVAAVLARSYGGQRSGRVRDVPDVRSIRWYSTIGLLDKPLDFRGRTALYGPRHLRQLVAVKLRQSEGKALAEIQAELAGASDEVLERVAGDVQAVSESEPDTTAERVFWSQPPVKVDGSRLHTDTPPGLAYGVDITSDVTVLVKASRPLDDTDIAAVRKAAAPLLRALDARGLTEGAHP